MRASTPLTHASMCCRAKGGSKRRVWRKIHIGIDERTLELRAVEVTGSTIGDAPMLPELLNQIPPDQDIGSVTADGAYDPGLRLLRAELIHWIDSETPLTP
jgi:hypothetical protein